MFDKSLFLIILSIYIIIWIFNPSNYLILFVFLSLLIIINLRTHDFKLSLFITFLASTLVLTGKTYPIQIIPPNIFNSNLYPDGYQLLIVVTPNHIFSFLMLVILIREVVLNKITYKEIFKWPGNLLFVLFLWNLVADYFGSVIPSVSMLLTLLGSGGIIMFYYVRLLLLNSKQVIKPVVSIFLAFIIFESFIAIQQYSHKSALGKNIEFTRTIEPPGRALDEDNFAYRPDGTFDHANTLGMNLVYWLIVSFSLIIKRSVKNTNNVIFTFPKNTTDKIIVGSFLMGLMSLIITLSRGSWVGMIISLMMILYILEKIFKFKIIINFEKKALLTLLVVILIMFSYFVYPRALKSIYSFSDGGGTFRKDQAMATSQIILNKPIFGVGTAMLPAVGLDYLPNSIFGKEPLDVHIWYLSVIANHGIIAIIIFIVFIVMSAKNVSEMLFNKTKLGRLTDYLRVGYLGLIVSFFVMGLFSANAGEGSLLLLTAILNEKN